MYGLFEDGYLLAQYGTLQACQAVAETWQYCLFIGG